MAMSSEQPYREIGFFQKCMFNAASCELKCLERHDSYGIGDCGGKEWVSNRFRSLMGQRSEHELPRCGMNKNGTWHFSLYK